MLALGSYIATHLGISAGSPIWTPSRLPRCMNTRGVTALVSSGLVGTSVGTVLLPCLEAISVYRHTRGCAIAQQCVYVDKTAPWNFLTFEISISDHEKFHRDIGRQWWQQGISKALVA